MLALGRYQCFKLWHYQDYRHACPSKWVGFMGCKCLLKSWIHMILKYVSVMWIMYHTVCCAKFIKLNTDNMILITHKVEQEAQAETYSSRRKTFHVI